MAESLEVACLAETKNLLNGPLRKQENLTTWNASWTSAKKAGSTHGCCDCLTDLTDTYQTPARTCWDGHSTPGAKC